MLDSASGFNLTKDGLFQLIAEEAFKDGVLDSWEKQVLQQMATFLKLGSEQVLAILKGAEESYSAGKLGAKRPLDPFSLYVKVLYFAAVDGVLDELELQMIAGLRQLFFLSDEDHQRALAAVQVRLKGCKDSLSPL